MSAPTVICRQLHIPIMAYGCSLLFNKLCRLWAVSAWVCVCEVSQGFFVNFDRVPVKPGVRSPRLVWFSASYSVKPGHGRSSLWSASHWKPADVAPQTSTSFRLWNRLIRSVKIYCKTNTLSLQSLINYKRFSSPTQFKQRHWTRFSLSSLGRNRKIIAIMSLPTWFFRVLNDGLHCI